MLAIPSASAKEKNVTFLVLLALLIRPQKRNTSTPHEALATGLFYCEMTIWEVLLMQIFAVTCDAPLPIVHVWVGISGKTNLKG